ncbi:hypothetical protein [Sphingomonas parapaucimobilis]|uniref:Uncharacterized protein n=1 Tax=Sphingomonas parapaucimobilis NBRC 15100 TaxID=1219049 RepID=A0A0A1WA73_9SPHN|nr:hypothetical protein [Sphingomonas parapaucimobilis]GAM01896.1 hypothetical protein SP5_069_01400 [Sphingomonas parapaucimobilis NBRC 15100]
MTAITAITAQDVVGQKRAANRNRTLDECRAMVGDKPYRFGFHTYSPEAMTDALFAIAGGRVTKVGL